MNGEDEEEPLDEDDQRDGKDEIMESNKVSCYIFNSIHFYSIPIIPNINSISTISDLIT